MPQSKKAVTKSAAVEKSLTSAIENLTAACVDGEKAIDVRSKESKKLALQVRKLSKKRTTLMRRKKAAAGKVRSAPSAEARKVLRDTTKEAALVGKELTKAKAEKSVVSTELAALKANQRIAGAYMKVIEKADKVLNKPKKKRKKRRAKKALSEAA